MYTVNIIRLELNFRILNRSITTCFANYSKRETKIMNKLMFGSSGKKRRYNMEEANKGPVLPSATSISKGAFEGGKSKNSKRINVLNKLFMKNITDLMATGEYAHEFVGRGIEISRVQTTPDFKGVNVFWLAKGSEVDEDLEKLFNKNAGALRHELSQLRVMGVVPMINFVKDKYYAKLAEVDIQLAKADFGEDYVPVNPSYRLKSEFSLTSKLPDDVIAKIEDLDDGYEDFEEEPLPQMRNDVFGLNHSHIMNKVRVSLKKSKAIHRMQPHLVENVNEIKIETSNPIVFESMRAQRAAFQEFLQKRLVMKAKAKREREKNYLPDKEYLKDISLATDDYLDEYENDLDEDFIEEIDDSKIR